MHQYATSPYGAPTIPNLPNVSRVNLTVTDLYRHSCLNGWTCGNIAATPADIARFHWDLHNGRIVNETSLAQMLTFIPMQLGWDPQLYGLGMMHTWPFEFLDWGPDPTGATRTIGHAGADYGSLGMMAGFNTAYRFGIAFASGSTTALNASLTYNVTIGITFFIDALCEVYDEVLAIVTDGSAPRLNCSSCPACPLTRRPSEKCLPELHALCPQKGPEPVGGNQSCVTCVAQHSQNVSAVGCDAAQIDTFCGVPVPPPPPSVRSPPVHITWNIP